MAGRRGGRVTLVAGALWLILWMAALMTAGWLMVSSLGDGDWPAALFLAVWLGIAAIALYRVGIGLLERLTGEELRRPRRRRRHERQWRDGMPGREES
jgi:hypothetical protein